MANPTEFVRITHAFDRYIGKVGKLLSHGQGARDPEEMFFVQIRGIADTKVFSANQVEYITEKEYFKGCLRG